MSMATAGILSPKNGTGWVIFLHHLMVFFLFSIGILPVTGLQNIQKKK